MTALVRLGWGTNNPAFRQMFASLFIPGATQEQMDHHNQLQRRCTSPDCAVRSMEAWADLDITELLPKVKVPTLVMHLREDAPIPFDEGKKLAAISGARFVALQGQSHLFLENEPAAQRYFEEINLFLGR
jgi:pimeloyl-ACP methyl ester carboxylesterase